MAGLSRMTVIGNLGADPEVRYSQSGTAMSNLRVAVTEKRREGDSWNDHTEWFTLVCFGKTAENAGRFLKKGRQIYGEGRFQARKWTDKEGMTRTSLEVICDRLMFLGSQRDEMSGPSSSGSNDSSFDPGDGYMNEDVPF